MDYRSHSQEAHSASILGANTSATLSVNISTGLDNFGPRPFPSAVKAQWRERPGYTESAVSSEGRMAQSSCIQWHKLIRHTCNVHHTVLTALCLSVLLLLQSVLFISVISGESRKRVHTRAHHGSNSCMMDSNLMTANSRLEKAATQARPKTRNTSRD